MGELPNPASLGDVLCFHASMDDPRGQPSPPVPIQLTLRQLCNPFEESLLQAVCGVHPLSTETTDPCDQSAPPCDGEDDPCGQPPPDKPPLTLRQWCTGTEESLLQAVCGVTPLTTSETYGPRGQTAPPAGDMVRVTPVVHLPPIRHPQPRVKGARVLKRASCMLSAVSLRFIRDCV